MKKSFLAIIIALAVVFQIRCSAGTDSNAQETLQEQPSTVQIYHNIPSEVLLTDIPFIAEFTAEILDGDIAYYVVQASDPKTEYLPNGVMHKEISVPVDLAKQDTTILIAAANSAGDITRVQVKVILNTDCPGCDLSWYGPNNSPKYRDIDFCGADLSYAKMRNLDLQGTSFCGANLTGIDFSSDQPHSEVTMHRAQFVGADLRDALFVNTYLIEIDFTDADLTGADLTSSPEIERCVWDNTTCPDGTNSDDNGGTCDQAL
jgi:hypothetical protein